MGFSTRRPMKILYTSDLHASSTHLDSMLLTADNEQVDCIIVGGDIIPHHLPDSWGPDPFAVQAAYLENVLIPKLKQFRTQHDRKIALDLGNDDFIWSRKRLEKYDGLLFDLMHFRKQRLTRDTDLIGYMCVPPTPFVRKDLEKPDSVQQPYAPGNRITLKGMTSVRGFLEPKILDLESKDTIEADLSQLSETIDRPFIFVSHAPPFNTPLDVLYNGIHAGSLSIAGFVKKWAQKGKLVASFHGHIHESPDRSGSISMDMEGSRAFNPGQGNGEGARFRYVVFELT